METLTICSARSDDDADELRLRSVARSSESIPTSIRKTWMPDLNSADRACQRDSRRCRAACCYDQSLALAHR